MDARKIKPFGGSDQNELNELIMSGDVVKTIRHIDELLLGANDENISVYLCRIFGIANSIIQCGFSISEECQFLASFVKDMKAADEFEDMYNIICREVQNVCGYVMVGKSANTANIVANVEEYVHQNYMNNELSVEYIAEKMHCSVSNINRKFKANKGITLGEYLSNYRVNMVKSDIISGISIKNIAENCGYTNVRTLNRSFRRITGMTPSEYKKIKATELVNNNKEYKYKYESALDFGKGICDTIMRQHLPKFLPPCSFYISRRVSLFSYYQGMFLLGMMKMYHLTHNEDYLSYAEQWVNFTLDKDGQIRTINDWTSLNSLDFRQPGMLLLNLYNATKDTKYLELVRQLVESLDYYPRNEQGGLNHFAKTDNIIWSGDAYMVCPICAMYAHITGMIKYRDMAVEQLSIIWQNMRERKGLIRHGWDCSKNSAWADKRTGLSAEAWCRATGFFMASVVDVMDYIEPSNPQYDYLMTIISEIVSVLVSHQSKKGGWYQIIDKPDLYANYIEFSGTCLILYAMAKAYRSGYIDKLYFENIAKGYKYVTDTIDFSKEGYLLMRNISASVEPSTAEEYLKQRKNTNDLHGAGAFALMCGEMSQIGL